MSANASDETLIQQALAGQQTAQAMLVKRYEKYVFTLAVRFVKNREEALEVAQDSFIRMFRYMADFRGDCRFTTWLYKIVYTTSLNHLRKQKPEILSLDDAERPIQLEDTGSPDASAGLEQEERHAALKKAIDRLLPDDGMIITLFYLYEQSLDEICQIMNLSMTNAKTKLCRARQRLKTILDSDFKAEVRAGY